jgi:hypothetical protein
VGVYIALLPPKAQPLLTGCKSNLKNLASAVEMYASDHEGRYPRDLQLLTPHYLKEIPTCPAARKLTYQDYQVTTYPDCFSFSCVGNNHNRAMLGETGNTDNLPAYHGEIGLISRPADRVPRR